MFKVYKKAKEHKDHQDYYSYESDQELAQFARKMKLGPRKYKWKFPFKFFDCGRVEHFLSKFPYRERSKKEDDQKFRNKS